MMPQAFGRDLFRRSAIFMRHCPAVPPRLQRALSSSRLRGILPLCRRLDLWFRCAVWLGSPLGSQRLEQTEFSDIRSQEPPCSVDMLHSHSLSSNDHWGTMTCPSLRNPHFSCGACAAFAQLPTADRMRTRRGPLRERAPLALPHPKPTPGINQSRPVLLARRAQFRALPPNLYLWKGRSCSMLPCTLRRAAAFAEPWSRLLPPSGPFPTAPPVKYMRGGEGPQTRDGPRAHKAPR